jgi:opacity protein-like surface antigen
MRAVIAVFVLFTVPGIALAQGNRAHSWEWSFAVLYQESKSMSSAGGSSLKVDDDYGLGVNFGYNLTDHLTLGVDLDWLSPDYQAVLVDDMVSPARTTTINHEFSQFNGRIKGTYTFLDGPLMPFVEAGIGWSYFDSNVLDGPPVTGCYWHPWWGYICTNFYSTFSETTFTYGAGVGLRYHFRGGSFLKASYNVWELDGIGNVSDSTISGARVEFGWGF